jgi:hypothetical protein
VDQLEGVADDAAGLELLARVAAVAHKSARKALHNRAL